MSTEVIKRRGFGMDDLAKRCVLLSGAIIEVARKESRRDASFGV